MKVCVQWTCSTIVDGKQVLTSGTYESEFPEGPVITRLLGV